MNSRKSDDFEKMKKHIVGKDLIKKNKLELRFYVWSCSLGSELSRFITLLVLVFAIGSCLIKICHKMFFSMIFLDFI